MTYLIAKATMVTVPTFSVEFHLVDSTKVSILVKKRHQIEEAFTYSIKEQLDEGKMSESDWEFLETHYTENIKEWSRPFIFPMQPLLIRV